MLTRVLSDKQDALLREERGLLMRLRTALARIDAAADQQEALDQSIAQLDELFLLVVVGEFNAGKSAFINALIGQALMQEGVTPTTAVITVLEHGELPEQTVRQANLLVIKAPIELLREIRIVDTPGTNAIIREHETMTAEFIPRSDLVFLRDLGRSPVHRNRARLHGTHPRLGQKNRRRRQQERHPRRPCAGRRNSLLRG